MLRLQTLCESNTILKVQFRKLLYYLVKDSFTYVPAHLRRYTGHFKLKTPNTEEIKNAGLVAFKHGLSSHTHTPHIHKLKYINSIWISAK